MKRSAALLLILLNLISTGFALSPQENQYVNELNYKRNKIEILVKKRLVNENTGYSKTDFYTTTYTQEAYSSTWGYGSTLSNQRSEVKEIEDWIIVKGGIKTLSDNEFLSLVEDYKLAAEIKEKENNKDKMRFIGNVISLGGIGYMLLSAGTDNSSYSVTTGGIITAVGFLLSAFNSPQKHYIDPDMAQEKDDAYNIKLKQALGLPITFE